VSIQTVLFGKRATVNSMEHLKMFQKKEQLVREATTLNALGAGSQDALSAIVSKIIRLNRKIQRQGAFVIYSE